PEGFGTAFLARLLAEFSQHYPLLTIDLIPVPKAIKLSHREADIVIAIDRPKSCPYIITRLSNYLLKLYGSKHYGQNNPQINILEHLKPHRFVDYVNDLFHSSALYSLERLPLQMTAHFRSNSFLAQQIAVSAAAGLVILPKFFTHDKSELQQVLGE